MRHCPDCRLLLTERKFGEVTLDVCSNCAGIWFDNGELRRAEETDSVALLRLEDEYTSPEINAIERPNLRR